jgi:hypothetical protein
MVVDLPGLNNAMSFLRTKHQRPSMRTHHTHTYTCSGFSQRKINVIELK